MNHRRRPRAAAGWALSALGFGAVALYDLVVVLRVRARADRFDHPLDHTALVGEGLGSPLRLVVLGDSSAAGFGLTDPASAYPRQVAVRLARLTGRRVAVRCYAHRGHRIRHVTERQVPLLAAAGGADVVAVSVGTNDALGRRLPWQVAADTRAMIAAIRAAAPGAAVVIGVATDLRHAPALPQPLRELVGVACRWVARAQERAAAELGVPTARLPATRDGFGTDGFHGGPAVHSLAAELTVRALWRHTAGLAGNVRAAPRVAVR